jgi:hypothetical protein
MNMIKYMVCILSAAMLYGCSTLKDSTLLGIGVGSVVGAGVGAAAGSPNGNEKRGAMTGAAVGAALGGLMGFLDFKERSKKEALKIGTGVDAGKEAPYLTKPKVQRVWVPEKIDGDKYISGHWIYVIERQSVWSKD